jgi:tetratricopeptide (TPR) repeat protein
MFKGALQGQEKALGVEHIPTLGTVNNLGLLYKSQGKFGETEKMYKRALQGYEKALGSKNGLTHIPALNTVYNLGLLYDSKGEKESSRAIYLRALEGYEKVYGHDHEECQDVRAKLSSHKSRRHRILKKIGWK